MKRFLVGAALAGVALASQAQLSFSGGTATSISGYNPTGPTAVQTAGIVDPTITSTGGILSATFLGFEANDNNVFSFSMGPGGTTVFFVNQPPGNTSTPVGTTSPGMSISSGVVPLTFNDVTTGLSISNGGSRPTPYGTFSVLGSFSGPGNTGTFTPYTLGGQYQLIIGFNDGLTVDADYDDMVIGLNVAAVPEPETYALMLAGIGAIGFIARRRRKSLGA